MGFSDKRFLNREAKAAIEEIIEKAHADIDRWIGSSDKTFLVETDNVINSLIIFRNELAGEISNDATVMSVIYGPPPVVKDSGNMWQQMKMGRGRKFGWH